MTATIYDISQKKNRIDLMAHAVKTLLNDPTNSFAALVFIALAIDGLVPPPTSKSMYVAYVQKHFSDLHNAIPAKSFYENVRCLGVHNFNLSGIGLARGSATGAYVVTFNDATGKSHKCLNLDRLAADFLSHIKTL